MRLRFIITKPWRYLAITVLVVTRLLYWTLGCSKF